MVLNSNLFQRKKIETFLLCFNHIIYGLDEERLKNTCHDSEKYIQNV